ncbi:MAG: endonuclease/exonuclease/phosphatase family protein [Acidimicrobiales bacterium]
MDAVIDMSDAPVEVDVRADGAGGPPEDAERGRRASERFRAFRVSPWWLLVVAPWSWFLIRGLHPWFELLAILLPLLLVGAALLMLLLSAYFRNAVLLVVAASLALLFGVAVVLPGRPITSAAPTEPTRFGSINLAQQWFTDNEVGFFVFDREPDVFVGVELREPHDNELREQYEYAVSDLAGFPPNPATNEEVELRGTYRQNDFPSVGVYSDHELVRLDDPIADRIEGGLPGFRVQVSTDNGNIVVYALHVPRLGSGSGIYEVDPSTQDEMLDAIANSIEAEELPVVVLGDLNIVDRGAAFNEFSDGLTDVMRVDRWAGPTRGQDVLYSLLRLRIDHILMSERLCAENARASQVFFSDHATIQADIGPCRAT